MLEGEYRRLPKTRLLRQVAVKILSKRQVNAAPARNLC